MIKLIPALPDALKNSNVPPIAAEGTATLQALLDDIPEPPSPPLFSLPPVNVYVNNVVPPLFLILTPKDEPALLPIG